MATEAAWLNGNNLGKEDINEAEKEKKRKDDRKALTLTGLLMEGLIPPRKSDSFWFSRAYFNVVSRARNSFGLASAKTFLISAACLRLGSVAFSYPPLLSAARLFGFLGPLFGLALLGFDFVQRERKTPRKPGRTLDL